MDFRAADKVQTITAPQWVIFSIFYSHGKPLPSKKFNVMKIRDKG